MDRSLILLLALSFFLGLACWLLFVWGVKTGEFDDLERPKHRMLDDDSDTSSSGSGVSKK